MSVDLHEYVVAAAGRGELVVQPRMGLSDPARMSAGLRAVVDCGVTTVGTITLDSYTRVGDHESARRAIRTGGELNGAPIVAWGAGTTARVAAAAGDRVPVQVRHGSSRPMDIFRVVAAAGLDASEGGPVSYCLPYGRTPLAESIAHWRDATTMFGEQSRAAGRRAHLETFGGCLLGQLCPPSLLIAVSLLEGLFFAQCGVESVSLSYAQQTNAAQDREALHAVRALADEFLPRHVRRHLVLYTYMGVFPRSVPGARRLLLDSAVLAAGGAAERLIVKTSAEAHRIPTVDENVTALVTAARAAKDAGNTTIKDQDHTGVREEARRIVTAVLGLSDDVGTALRRAFAQGVLDVPYCLHADNRGLTRGMIDDDGRLVWAATGRLPVPAPTGGRRSALTSDRLLTMLRHTAERYDGAALPGPERAPLRIAVVGTGPRGLAVLERLAARQSTDPDRPVEVYAIDDHEVGAGRIWRTDQPEWFLMNTVAGEVTMFSGPPDAGPDRPGNGPSLAEWWQRVEPERADPDGYASRATYGRYLRFVYDTIEARLPVHRVAARVTALEQGVDGRVLRLSGGRTLTVDRVLLATGHPIVELDDAQRRLAEFAAARPGLHYLPGDSAADLPLDLLPAGSTVGVAGLGLSFYDVLSALTLGRGGRFTEEAGGLRYLPSGREPLVVAGSRSGLPQLARGRNQKPAVYSYRPRFFTRERMLARRARGPVDLVRDVLPWLRAEMELVYYTNQIRTLAGTAAAAEFARAADGTGETPPDLHALAARFAGAGEALPDLQALARPFADRWFDAPEHFHQTLTAMLHADLAAAAEGNADGPLKAALDVLRDTRAVLRLVTDFGGLDPASHRDGLLGWFTPVASLLAAGPPIERLEQLLALIRAGVVRIVGPEARFGIDGDGFAARSPRVRGSAVRLDAIVEARIPQPDLARDTSPLTRQLRAAGVLTGFVNRGGGDEFHTGGVAVTPAPFHPIGADGEPDTELCVLGIPTEHTRWFTQVGSGRPGDWGEFARDADAVAQALLRADRLAEAVPAGSVVAR